MTDSGEGPGPPGLLLIFESDYGGKKGIGNLNIRQKRKQQLCKCIMLFLCISLSSSAPLRREIA